jgi:tetratricopeptide (TPR) repeat protein
MTAAAISTPGARLGRTITNRRLVTTAIGVAILLVPHTCPAQVTDLWSLSGGGVWVVNGGVTRRVAWNPANGNIGNMGAGVTFRIARPPNNVQGGAGAGQRTAMTQAAAAFTAWNQLQSIQSVNVNFVSAAPANANPNSTLSWVARAGGAGDLGEALNARVNNAPRNVELNNVSVLRTDGWNLNSIRQFDIYTIAVHEAGHVLGLGHPVNGAGAQVGTQVMSQTGASIGAGGLWTQVRQAFNAANPQAQAINGALNPANGASIYQNPRGSAATFGKFQTGDLLGAATLYSAPISAIHFAIQRLAGALRGLPLFAYNYTLTNDSAFDASKGISSGYMTRTFTIPIDPNIVVTDLQAPTGWTLLRNSDSLELEYTGPIHITQGGLLPGQSVSFSFDAYGNPVPAEPNVHWTVDGLVGGDGQDNDSAASPGTVSSPLLPSFNYADFGVEGGTYNYSYDPTTKSYSMAPFAPVLAPAAVPEPSTIVMMVTGVVILLGCRWVRRRRVHQEVTCGGARRPSWSGLLALGMMAMLSPASVPSARAGSVWLTLDMVVGQGESGAAGMTAAAPSPKVGALERAVASFDRGDYESCLKDLGEAARTDAALLPAPIALARLAIQKDRADLVRPALERAVREIPDHPEVYFLFGELAVREGRWTDAALHFNRGRDLAAADRWAGEPRRGYERRRLQGEARIAEARGDWEAAKAALEGGLRVDPDDATTRHRLGRALFHLAQYDPAYEELQRASGSDQAHALDPPAITMGWLFQEAGDRAKAGEWMDYAARSAPGSAPAHLGLAAWLQDQGRAAEARPHAAEAVRLDPRSAAARRLLGLIERTSNQLDRAREIYQALAREAPEDPWICNELALVLAEQPDEARRREALELAERNVRRAPGSPEALATLGLVYHRLRRLDEADAVLQAVVASGQASSDALYTLARVRADRGRAGDAPGLLKAALAAPGFFAARDQARSWLETLTAAGKS